MPGVSDPQTPIVSVRILGGVHAVAGDGSLIDLPSASQRRLLAILALHSPRRLRSEWLADMLDISPGALRTSVSRVRSTVGSAILETASTGYALVGDVDAAQFCRAVADAADADDRVRALQLALDHWNGPALEEFFGEEWADGEIARLTEIHAGTVDDLAEELIEARRPADAVALLEAQIARFPYRDRPRGLLIRALAGAGRQADALRAFQQYRSSLIDEFGTDPSPDVVRIERRVATGWDGVESATIAGAVPEPVATNEAVDIPLPSALGAPGRIRRAGQGDGGTRERAHAGIDVGLALRDARRGGRHRQDGASRRVRREPRVVRERDGCVRALRRDRGIAAAVPEHPRRVRRARARGHRDRTRRAARR